MDEAREKQYIQLMKKASNQLADLRAELNSVRAAQTEPIAIVGIGCRFPGGIATPEDFWQFLCAGQDAITETPPTRWNLADYYDADPDAPGKLHIRHGCFLTEVDTFDAQFFGISPREAMSLDPQQRLFLEVGWEAFERAGQAPTALFNSRTGVFVGISLSEYQSILAKDGEALFNDLYSGTGTALSVAAGRLSYILGLTGPSLAVDTACSSSLVSVHLACQSLRNRECDLALAGGVNVMLMPETTMVFAKARMLAPDGRCKTFDAAANGYVRGEGCGAVVLKRLSDALADDSHILAVIRGSAINQDGRSGGLTVPNGPAQQAVIRQALTNGGVEPAQVHYIEAHGAGTPLGDPIELGALHSVFQERTTPIWVGSVKTNIGHLESAAGIAGLIKVALSLYHGEIPPHLHFRTPNPYVAWAESPIRVPTNRMSWPQLQADQKRLAGVSSFGFSGTNAHIVLEEAPAPKSPVTETTEPWHVLNLSAKTEPALLALAQRYAEYWATQPAVNLADLCATANTGRSHFAHRLSVVSESLAQCQKQLHAFVKGERLSGIVQGRTVEPPLHKVAWLFTGQGAQYLNMGRDLYQHQPLFRQTLERCDELLRGALGESLLNILYPVSDDQRLHQTAYTQPALFALEYALAELWKSWGIQPSIVIGHSVGEIVAACVAGVFTLEDGLKLIVERGRLMQALPQIGEMVAVRAPEAQVNAMIAADAHQVAIAAVNGPNNVVISGQQQAIQRIVEQLATLGSQTQRLTVSHAFHSPLMAPMLPAFRKVAQAIAYRRPQIPLVSNLTGALVTDEVTEPEYWVRHVGETVRFADGVATLFAQGAEVYLEIGPQPTLLGMVQPLLDAHGSGAPTVDLNLPKPLLLPSLRKGQNDWRQLLQSRSELYVRGVELTWENLSQEAAHRTVMLPTYPFQRQRYWVERKSATARQSASPVSNSAVLQLIEQGQTQPLLHLLAETKQFTEQEARLLPTVLDALIQQHQTQRAETAIDDYFYEMTWHATPRLTPTPDTTEQGKGWLILADELALAIGEGLANQLRATGTAVRLLDSTALTNSAQFNAALESIETPLQRVVYLCGWATPAEQNITDVTLAAAHQSICERLLHLVQTLAQRQNANQTTRLSIVTRGAQWVQGTESSAILAQSPIWGLGRVIALEFSRLWGGLIDLAPEGAIDPTSEIADLLAELHGADGTEQIAFRAGKRYAARLQRSTPPTTRVTICADATYLITGGTGGLGLQVARQLAEAGARHLVLISRRGITTVAQQQAVEQLQQMGAHIQVAQMDVAEQAEVAELLTAIEASGAPLRGVIHTAGLLDDGILLNQSWTRFAAVMAAKIRGSWHLHTLTQSQTLDFFVLFSSVSSLFGAKGQANYAAANSFMDALAHYRQKLGLPGLSINWGAWSEVGMAAENKQTASDALRSLTPGEGRTALKRLLGAQGQYGVMAVDWARFSWPTLANRALFTQWLAAKPSGSALDAVSFVAQLKSLPVSARLGHLITHIQTEVEQILRMNALPDARLGFADMGMDSLMALELKQRLDASIGTQLPATVAFEYPTVERLATYLLADLLNLMESEPKPALEALTPIIPTHRDADPIAIIGMGCRFPGAATPEEFWQLLANGVDCVGEIPPSRWQLHDYYAPAPAAPGKMYVKQAAFIDGVDQFDPQFFGISPREAESLDPQQRLLLEVGWEALERAGYAPSQLAHSQTGVFVGISQNDYAELLPKMGASSDFDVYAVTGNGTCFASGRLSYVLQLQGPNLAVDTACSSSLVALHLACQSLRQGECNLALAGGVQLMLSPALMVSLSQMNALAPDGRCKTFDAAADGYGRGEGCGMVVLKRLSTALADGDPVLALIRGSAINHDGPSSGLTVPNKAAQAALIQQALTNAGVQPHAVGYVDAHGTGTALGDPIELRALDAVFQPARQHPLWVGSVKTNIGHLEAAAGIASVIKVVLALQHGVIPPHLHFETPTPHIDWAHAPCACRQNQRSGPILKMPNAGLLA